MSRQTYSFALTLFVLLSLYRVITMTVPDPCPSGVTQVTIADMCMETSGTEEAPNGNSKLDSVVLRVVTQQEGCYCYVTVQNHTGISYPLYMRKYNLHSSSAPEVSNCGLAIDIDYPNLLGVFKNNQSIVCTAGTDQRSMSLKKDGKLEFRSRIISGSFTRGYCMQIYRQHSENDIAKIQINCNNSTTTIQTTALETTGQDVFTTRKLVDTTSQHGFETMQVVETTSQDGFTTRQVVDTSRSFYQLKTDATTLANKIYQTELFTELSTNKDATTNIGNTLDQLNKDENREPDCTSSIVIGTCSGILNVILVMVIVILLKRRIENPVKAPNNTNMDYETLGQKRDISKYSSLKTMELRRREENQVKTASNTDIQNYDYANKKDTPTYTSLYSPSMESQQYEVVSGASEYSNTVM